MAFSRIDQNRASELIKEQNAVVVDIRDAASFQAGHIQGAIRLDQSNLEQFMQSADRTVPLVVCCYHGNSSQGAAEFFNQQGFAECFSLDGGYTAWRDAGLG